MKTHLDIDRVITVNPDKVNNIRLEVKFKNVHILTMRRKGKKDMTNQKLVDIIDEDFCRLVWGALKFRNSNIIKRVWSAIWNG